MDIIPIFVGLREFYGSESFQYFEREDGSIEAYLESTPLFSELKLKVSKSIPVKRDLLMTEKVEDNDEFIIYKIENLPHIFLEIKVPPDSSNNISFKLHSAWLSDEQIAKVLNQTKVFYQDTTLESPITDFLAFIDHDLLSAIFPDFNSTQTISFETPAPVNLKIVDCILEYNEECLRKVFPDKVYECSVCFDDVRGSKCFRFTTCGHLFCRNCIRRSFESSINSGIQENYLQCLECQTEVPEFEVRMLLPRSVFKKYDNILLSKALQQMPDVIQCPMPKCLTNVITISPRLAKCPNCDFAFCPKCKRTYHGPTNCSLADSHLIEEIVKLMEGDDEELKRDLCMQHGKENVDRILNEHYSKKYLEENSQKCPKCQAYVQRAYGCCVMRCFLCDQVFCWLCLAKLDPKKKYEHFYSSSSCKNRLFDALPIDEIQNDAYVADLD
ncbi:unnamed protein product [Hymenolepis diminuta]|uniref:RBR-type E3 ubiquitin transferase n=1 Tax=Hymenolepis diminuta TaxID=6216 RepID=A0A0R3SDY2_HYMDI|nr:unnamed protein product [Hymenolepis diminuta]